MADETKAPKRVMISSTSLDLPEHRKQAIDACLRLDAKPEAMEHLSAKDKTAIAESLEMVDKADVYIGIFAWRYGTVPDGHDISISEMEFNRAVEREIPILVFLMDEEHPIQSIKWVDNPRDRVEEFRERVVEGRLRQTFISPWICADTSYSRLVSCCGIWKSRMMVNTNPRHSFTVFQRFPRPEPYVAHPYSLLQTKDVVGRREELRMLTDWVTKPENKDIRIFNVCAIGGMGKSALTWKWFEEIAPQELRNKLDGRMWWSFYESDAHFENFVIRALAYVSGQPEKVVRKEIKPGEREDQLIRILDERPFLLALDGLERILIAYARMDAARMLDDDLDEETMNRIYEAQGVPEDVRETYLAKHRLRLTADPRAGQFLRRLTRVRESRILITTRLYPADIQTQMGQPFPGCRAIILRGLTDDDALQLWREFGVSGSSAQLQGVFRSVRNYPLLIRALAGEVGEFRPAPGDFDAWRAANPEFDPVQLDLINARTHILEFALQGLGESQRSVLQSIAAFSMPATFDTIRALHVGEGKVCAEDSDLDNVLTELEDRGLLGWDKVANRYDLHPIVRSVVWDGVEEGSRERIFTGLQGYFEAVPKPKAWHEVESFEDLTTAIELYRSLIGLKRYQDAFVVMRDHLAYATLYRLSANRQRAELLELLIPDGSGELPRLDSTWDQSITLNSLGLAYLYGGEPERALSPFRQMLDIKHDIGERQNIDSDITGLCNLAEALINIGFLREAGIASFRSLALSREINDRYQENVSLILIGNFLDASQKPRESEIALRRAVKINSALGHRQFEGCATAFLARCLLKFNRPAQAAELADRAWELAHVERVARDFPRSARIQGAAALELNEYATASERLQHALTRARSGNQVDEELVTLGLLAELHRRKGNLEKARELLDALWEPARRGPYTLFHADARNTLAQIEIDSGNLDAARNAAFQAFELSWCDGPPYAYAYGLNNAKSILGKLNAAEPELPPFNESNFEPMPKVEINPRDEYWVNPENLES